MSDVTIDEVATELGLSKGERKGDYTEYYCPIHDSPPPSGTPDLCVYHDDFCCFSDSDRSGGKAISLIMHCEQMNHIEEAIEWLEDHFPEQSFSDLSEEEIETRAEVREALNQISETAYLHLKKEHRELYKYIKDNRNFSDDVMEDAQIGFISNGLAETLKKRYDDEILLKTGLFYQKDEEDDIRCQLWNRIIFPYTRGEQTWYMIGRKPGDHGQVPKPYREFLQKSNAKYKKLNTTDYNKHIVYEWHQDSDNNNRVVITEGITDAISAHAAGVNVSSPVTTRYSDKDIEQVCQNAKHFDNVYIAMDADEEGRKGARKTSRELAKHGIEAQIIELGQGDLDDYTTKHGYSIEKLLDDADFFIDLLNQDLEEAGRNEITDIKYKIFETIKEWDAPRQDQVLSNLSEGSKRENKKQFKTWKKQNQDTEQTEQTEQTEGGTPLDPRVCAHGEDEKDYLNKLANQTVNDKKRLAGKIGDTYFFTVWIQDEGLERPAAVTSNDQVQFINHKLSEKQGQLGEDQELSDEQKEKYDFWYAEIDGKEIKFQHEIPKTSKQAISNLDNRIIKYLTGEKELRDKEQLFESARELLSDYWSHYQEEWYDVSIAYNFHTYLLPVLGYTAYILLKGRPQTGKTTWQKVNSKLCYNGCFAGNLTPATAVRYAHSYFATLHQDEMEKQSDERRNQMQGLYNTGQRKGGVYNITNTDAGDNIADQIQEIRSFCAKSMSVNDIFGFADSFMSRNVILKTVKTNEKGLNDPDSMTPEQEKQFKDLQAEMAYYVLQNHEEILASIDDVRSSIDDTARDEDKMALFKGIVQHFKGHERADKVEERIRDSQRMKEVNKVGERVTVLFEEISGVMKEEDGKIVQIRASDLKDSINDSLGLSKEDEYRATSKSVIRNLKEYDVMRRSNQKKKDSGGYTCIEINRSEFMDACNRYEMTSIYQDLVTTDSSEDNGENGDTRTQTQGSEPVTSQSAQSAQSAQSNRVNYPSNSQIKRTIKKWQEDSDRPPNIDITELEDHFVDVFSDCEQVRERFSKQPDRKPRKKTGVARLLHDGDCFEPESGKVQVI